MDDDRYLETGQSSLTADGGVTGAGVWSEEEDDVDDCEQLELLCYQQHEWFQVDELLT